MSFQLSQLLVGIISKLPAIRGPSWLCLAPSTLSLRQTGATHWEKPTLTQVIPLTNIFFLKINIWKEFERLDHILK